MKKAIKEKQMGVFSLSHDLITKHPGVVRKFLSKMLIIKAEFLYINMGIEYTAYGKDFLPVAVGIRPKEYELEIVLEKDKRGKKVVKKIQVKW